MAQKKSSYLQKQYSSDSQMKIAHNYLQQQFRDYKEVFNKLEQLVARGDFTLGKDVKEFEQRISDLVGTKYVLGVGNGTDALFLSLKSLDIASGDEVITTPYTFVATSGAIVTAGAKPIFVDIREDYNIDSELIEEAITDKTKAILPVHWAGLPCEMDRITEISTKYNIPVIEDASQAIASTYHDKPAGSFGITGCFSLHPLKNLNVWGDGGFITTNNKEIFDKLSLLRNHGLINRDECNVFAYNSRLDTLQAIVANHLLDKLDDITNSRISNAEYYDKGLKEISQIKIPDRDPLVKQVYHLYIIKAEKRDELRQDLNSKGIDVKVHYPIPLHLQNAANYLGYKKGDFPIAERTCESILSLPVHEFITRKQQDYVIDKIKEFYIKNG